MVTFYDPEVEWDVRSHPLGRIQGPSVYRGYEALEAMFREYFEAWENVESSVDELIDAGEQVISVVTDRGRGRASGVEVERPGYAGVWTLRDGKIIRVAWFSTRADALEAAGLKE